MNMLSRRNEFQADAYAVKLGCSKGLQSGLVKLQLENLGNMVRQVRFAMRSSCRSLLNSCPVPCLFFEAGLFAASLPHEGSRLFRSDWVKPSLLCERSAVGLCSSPGIKALLELFI